MRKKRVTALLTACALMVGALAGCGGNSTAPAESSSAGGETQKQEVNAENADAAAAEDDGEYYVDMDGTRYKKFDDVRLTMLICWVGKDPVASDQYGNEVATAIRDRIGVTVEKENVTMNEAEKLNMMFASGDMPDIVDCAYWGGTSSETTIVNKAAREGRVTDISDLVPQYENLADAWKLGYVSQRFIETELDQPDFNGARYILPKVASLNEQELGAYGVFVRGDVPEALGIDPTTIKTTDQLWDFMVKARDYGFTDVNGNDCIVATAWHNGNKITEFTQNFYEKGRSNYFLDENGKIGYRTLSDDWLNEQLFFWKMIHENVLDKECFTTSDERANEKVGNGTALFTCGRYHATIDATKSSGLYDAHPELRYVPVGPLNYRDGEPLTELVSEGTDSTPIILFPSTCSNIEAALTYLNYVNSREGRILTRYGFEGDTFEYNEDGQPRMTEEWVSRYQNNQQATRDELRERGINDLFDQCTVIGKGKELFGESEPFMGDNMDPYLKSYWEMRPFEVWPGYPIDAAASGFENYQEFAQWAFDGSTAGEYTQRAYFADSEEEAREILEEYQNYLMTNDNGKMQEFLDYMTEQYGTRDDWAF